MCILGTLCVRKYVWLLLKFPSLYYNTHKCCPQSISGRRRENARNVGKRKYEDDSENVEQREASNTEEKRHSDNTVAE